MLHIYGDIGLAALPLGEDGLPMPESNSDETVKAQHFLACVAERDLDTLLPVLPRLAQSMGKTVPVSA